MQAMSKQTIILPSNYTIQEWNHLLTAPMEGLTIEGFNSAVSNNRVPQKLSSYTAATCTWSKLYKSRNVLSLNNNKRIAVSFFV